MPIIQIDGIGDVEVDESFLKLSPADQQKTVEEIAASKSGGTQTKPDTSFTSAAKQAVAAVPQALGKTLRTYGAEDTGKALEGAVDSPANYKSASGDIHGIVTDAWRNGKLTADQAMGVLSSLPRAMVEQAGNLGAVVAGGAAGALAGGPVGGLAGAASVGAGLTIGDVAFDRAKNNGRDAPNTEDALVATGTGIASGALDAVGARGLGKASSSVIGGLIKHSFREGGTEVAQSGIEQTGSSIGTQAGLKIDPAQMITEGLIGAGTGAAFHAPAAVKGAASRVNQIEGTEGDSSRRLAARIKAEAESLGADLKDVNRDSAKGAEVTLSNVHNDIAEEIKGLSKVLSDQLDPMQAATLEQFMERLGINGSLRDARNKVKSTVSERDFARLEGIVGNLAEGQQLIETMRQSNELTTLFRQGMRGGISQFTDELAPLGRTSRYLPAGADNNITRLLATGIGAMTNPAITAAQMTAWGGGRAIDALTGSRSRVNKFVRQQLDPSKGPVPGLTQGSPSLLQGRAQAATVAAAEAERGQELRLQRMNNDDPGVGGFDNSVWQQTGLRPQQAVRGLGILAAQQKITAAEARSYIDDPKSLMANNVGNRVIDQLNTLASEGLLTRDPSWERNPQTVPAPSNRQMSYAAQAAGNQARVTEAVDRIQQSSLAPNTKNLVASAIARIGKTNNKADARAVLQELEAVLPGPVAKQLARQEISPLISQIRHADRSSAEGAIPRGLDLAKTKTGNAKTRKQADAYKRAAGIDKPPLDKKLEAPIDYLKKVADVFQRSKHSPDSKATKKAYDALISETLAQYEFLGDIKVEAWTGKGEPYPNSATMMADVQDNGHLYFLMTDTAFGDGGDAPNHPLLRTTKYSTEDGRPLLANDVFRIVHDYFGHTQQGFAFGPVGEYNAFHEHARMFSDAAIPALAAETLAQNAWVNFGKHLRDSNGNIPQKGEPGYKQLADRQFAGQKAFAFNTGILDEDPNSEATSVAKKIRSFSPFMTEEEKQILSKRTAKKLVDMIMELPSSSEMAAVAWSGRAKKGWYLNSAHALLKIFGPEDAPRFAALLAALSPQTSVESNLRNALNVWRAWTESQRPTDHAKIMKLMGENVEGGGTEASVLDAWKNNSLRALTSPRGEPIRLSGPKVNSFMLNLLGVVNEVTNDAWMATYANIDQALFSSNYAVQDPDSIGVVGDKRFGYIAMNIAARAAADKLTKSTGMPWDPSEIQETIWSWAKALYEKRDARGENRTTTEIVNEGALTEGDIAGTPDFEVLLVQDAWSRLLKGTPYEQQIRQLQQSRASSGEDNEGSGGSRDPLSAEGSGIGQSAFKRHLTNAADRLEAVREKRLTSSGLREEANTEDVPATPFDDEIGDVPFDIRTNPGETEIGRFATFDEAVAAREASGTTGRVSLDDATDEWVALSSGRTSATPAYEPYPQDPPERLKGRLVIGLKHPESGALLGASAAQVRTLIKSVLGEDRVQLGVNPAQMGGANGSFTSSNMSIKVAQGLDKEAFDRVSTHEAGHAIARISGVEAVLEHALTMKGDHGAFARKVKAEMNKISKHARPTLWITDRAAVAHIYQPHSYDSVKAYRERIDEVTADFVSIYLTDPGYVAKHAPNARTFVKTIVNQGKTARHPQLGKFSLKGKLELLSLTPLLLAAQALAALAVGGDDEDKNKLGA